MADREEAGEVPLQLDASSSTVVVVDNVPRTEMKRYEKLYAVIRKIFGSYGTIIDDGLYIPVEGDPQMTCGYAFIEYETAEMATRAVLEGNMRVRTYTAQRSGAASRGFAQLLILLCLASVLSFRNSIMRTRCW